MSKRVCKALHTFFNTILCKFAQRTTNIKNKGILISSKRLLEENNINILQMIKNAGERSKISLIDISHLNDENEINNKRKKDYQIVVLKEKIIYKLLYLKIKVRYCPVIH